MPSADSHISQLFVNMHIIKNKVISSTRRTERPINTEVTSVLLAMVLDFKPRVTETQRDSKVELNTPEIYHNSVF